MVFAPPYPQDVLTRVRPQTVIVGTVVARPPHLRISPGTTPTPGLFSIEALNQRYAEAATHLLPT